MMKVHSASIRTGRTPGGRLRVAGGDSTFFARDPSDDSRGLPRVRGLAAQPHQFRVHVIGVAGGFLEADVDLSRVLIGEQAPCGGRTQDGARREPGRYGRGRGFVRRATLTERPFRNCRCGGRPRASRRGSFLRRHTSTCMLFYGVTLRAFTPSNHAPDRISRSWLALRVARAGSRYHNKAHAAALPRHARRTRAYHSWRHAVADRPPAVPSRHSRSSDIVRCRAREELVVHVPPHFRGPGSADVFARVGG